MAGKLLGVHDARRRGRRSIALLLVERLALALDLRLGSKGILLGFLIVILFVSIIDQILGILGRILCGASGMARQFHVPRYLSGCIPVCWPHPHRWSR